MAVFTGGIILVCGCGRKEYSSGREIFAGECVQCHKLEGNGGSKGPELTDILIKHNEKYLRVYTTDPRSIKPDSTMPPADLNDRELDLLVSYLKNTASRTPGGTERK